MPANLPPQYQKAEEEYRRAATPQLRLEKLRELFRMLPKHKGTEKLQAELKKKISQARDEAEGGAGTGKGGAGAGAAAKKGGASHKVPRDGAGQIVFLGAPNAGKSAVLAALTNAKPEVAAFPFTTRVPIPGMLPFQQVRIQLIDLPPITADAMESWQPNLVRAADSAALIVSLADDDLTDSAEAVLNQLARARVELVGELPEGDEDETVIHVPTILIANQCDADGAEDRWEFLREWAGARFPIVKASATRGDGLDDVRRSLYDSLGVIRIFTKTPGKPADLKDPFALPAGSTVLDLAKHIHRDFEQSLKSARVWGSAAFDGQAVKRDHELRDSDVVELHV